MNYIKNGQVFSIPFELDDRYNIGSTWEDVTNGKFVKLTDGQNAFYAANPTATINEIWACKISETPSRTIEEARNEKMNAIQQADDASNKFFVSVTKGGVELSKVQLWISCDKRTSLLTNTLPSQKANGATTTKLWDDGTPPQIIEVPITWAEEKLPLLEVYAKATYDLMQSNKAAVYAATTVEAVDAIDVTKGYPDPLTFVLEV